ncbi:MAG: host attachment protein [Verrucomicrobiales bacterium]|nr:host attachment protein [Verrucomicrobiales bacterium]
MKTPDLYLIANGNSLRAFRCNPKEEGVEGARSHLAELKLEEADAHPKGNIEDDTDRPGRFDANQGRGNQSNLVSGENHSLSQEHEKRQAAALALAVQRVIKSNHASSWSLVAPAQWKNEILSFVPSEISKHLLDSTEGDWVKFPHAKIESRLLG